VEIGRSFGDAIGAGRLKRVYLTRRTACLEIAVDLVGRDLDVAGAGLAHQLEQRLGANELGAPEIGGAQDRSVDVSLGGEVDDRLALLRRPFYRLRIADVADDELDPEPSRLAGLPSSELVEHDYLVARALQALGETRADEAGTACDEYTHSGKPNHLMQSRRRPMIALWAVGCFDRRQSRFR